MTDDTVTSSPTSTDAPEEGRSPRPVVVGVVTSNKMQKTITVKQERLVKHPRYGKYVRRYTKYKAHDPNEEAQEGDKVEITQTRPLSKDKCWRLTKILSRPEIR